MHLSSKSSQLFSESGVCNRDADASTIWTRVNMLARVLSRRRNKPKTAGKEKKHLDAT
jgi:hypothetical protein